MCTIVAAGRCWPGSIRQVGCSPPLWAEEEEKEEVEEKEKGEEKEEEKEEEEKEEELVEKADTQQLN